ncbi:hypothetical protein BJX96DRAFT_173363 [Aspergillus floccosus]
MPILDHVPDVIREKALKDGVPNVGDVPDATGLAGWAPAELQQAYQNGDYATIQSYTTKTANDLNPIYQNVQNNADAAFFNMPNQSDGIEYKLSIAGDPDDPYGYMWVYAYPPSTDSGSSAGSDGSGSSTPKLAHVAQIGTYSTSGQTLSISNRLWSNMGVELPASSIATIVATVVFKYLKNYMTSQDSSSAMDEAAAAAGDELIDDGVVTAVDWTAMVAGVSAFGVGIVAGAVVFFLIMFITNFIDITFTVAVNIYNWDPNHSYILLLTSCYWNEDEIKLPDGFEPSGETVYSYLTVTFANSNTWFEGLGLAMIVQSSDGSTSLGLKYDCPYTGSNSLGLTGMEGVGDAQAYYEDPNTWAPSGSYTSSSMLPGYNVQLTCSTTALSGASDQFYQFDVHIGLKPSSGDSAPGQGQPAVSLVKPPAKAPVVKPGDTVRLPTGNTARVVPPASKVQR